MTPDNALDSGKSKAATAELRREEGVENPGPNFLRHPAAGVTDGKPQAIGVQNLMVADGPYSPGGRNVSDADRDDALVFAERLRGICEEVHNDLPHLRRIGLDNR